MWSWSEVLTPWDVKEYVYCPLIPWIARVYGVREPETYSMKLGAEERARRKVELDSLGLEPPIKFDVEMYSSTLKMAGVADAVAGSKRYTIVEVKAFKRRRYSHFKAQLMAYALLCEECVGPARKAVLVIEGRPLFWDVDYNVLDETRRIILKLREALEREKPPLTQPTPKCLGCWYRRLCPNS
ncbi:MAG: CRISPR-associated protein Cas4 [Thermofilaceae archaeon]|nr:CRISPR-associated protein Cas4 [Thermofilaceae archaeon]MDW8004965.1 CRISPR-associated protein Cas4 [Thermofilaceae archaeon]